MATKAISNIKCALVNIQSVGNKTCGTTDYIIVNKLDILVLTETWFNNSGSAKIREMTHDTHNFLNIPRENRRGGGVGILISNSFSKIKMEKVFSLWVKQSPNIGIFKRNLKTHIFSDCYQSGEVGHYYRT